MKFKYYPETNTLYIKVKDTPSVESEEIANGVVIDLDEKGEITGIEIDNLNNVKELNIPILASLSVSV